MSRFRAEYGGPLAGLITRRSRFDSGLRDRSEFGATAWPAVMLGILTLLVALWSAAAGAAEVEIPPYSLRYRASLERAAGDHFGLNAPVARLAAQIHQESLWKPGAASPYAQGLAQFTPPTARWLPTICPSVGAPDPWDPQWSIRAVACYDAWLYANAPRADECNRWAFVLSDYNGGQGMRIREQRLAAAAGKDSTLWWSNVEEFNARSAQAWKENRSYVRRILLLIEPAYLAADWGGKGVCL